eukprot:COSAG02_NODE_3474_length_6681_cov_29.310696_2_plen_94_part_00
MLRVVEVVHRCAPRLRGGGGGDSGSARLAPRLVLTREESGMARLVALVVLPLAAHAQPIWTVPAGCARWFDGAFALVSARRVHAAHLLRHDMA